MNTEGNYKRIEARYTTSEPTLNRETLLEPQTIGEEGAFLGCPEIDEGQITAPSVIAEIEECECKKNIYLANQAGNRCFEYNIMYWYHPDYPSAPLRVRLGSVEFVTDNNGAPYQFFFNTPFGENLKNQFVDNYRNYKSHFRFNEGQALKNKPVAYFSEGARLPRWRGNFYYGARYYDPKISGWLSVDPLARKYPELSPYTYVANNPINLVDPDGRDIWRVKNGRLTLYKKTGDNYNVFQNAKGTEVFRTNQQVNWNNQDRPINENVKDYKQIVGLIANDRTSQNRMKDRANETGWDDSQFYSAGEFVDRMKTQAESQKKADAIGLGKDAVLTVVVPGGVPFLDDAALIEQWNELINNGETIPETMMRNGQQAIDNGQSFWSDLKYSVKSTINNIENAVKNGNAPW